MTWDDEFEPTLRKALADPEFQAEYARLCSRHAREYLGLRPSGRLRSWLRWRFGSWERFLWWLGDWEHWAGWVSDPAEVETATAWLSLHWIQLSAWRNGRDDVSDRARLVLLHLPFGFRVCVAAMWQ